jgi:hypothetical protein
MHCAIDFWNQARTQITTIGSFKRAMWFSVGTRNLAKANWGLLQWHGANVYRSKAKVVISSHRVALFEASTKKTLGDRDFLSSLVLLTTNMCTKEARREV